VALRERAVGEDVLGVILEDTMGRLNGAAQVSSKIGAKCEVIESRYCAFAEPYCLAESAFGPLCPTGAEQLLAVSV